MKKTMVYILAAMLVAALLCGCGDMSDKKTAPTNSPVPTSGIADDDMMPDAEDGIVDDGDGIIEDEDDAERDVESDDELLPDDVMPSANPDSGNGGESGKESGNVKPSDNGGAGSSGTGGASN